MTGLFHLSNVLLLAIAVMTPIWTLLVVVTAFYNDGSAKASALTNLLTGFAARLAQLGSQRAAVRPEMSLKSDGSI